MSGEHLMHHVRDQGDRFLLRFCDVASKFAQSVINAPQKGNVVVMSGVIGLWELRRKENVTSEVKISILGVAGGHLERS